MRQVTKVWLRRAEGPTELCTGWIEFASFDDANTQLQMWATTAPDTGGYDKCDFKVEYDNDTDDDAYEGRFDLQYEHRVGGRLIQEHMEAFILWYWGLHIRDRTTGELVKT